METVAEMTLELRIPGDPGKETKMEEQGPLSRLMEGHAVETDQGMSWVRPLDAIVETAKMAEGDICPVCNHHSKLFFGDPDGEFWCIACQIKREFGFE